MARVAPPPPAGPVAPHVCDIPAGSRLFRIFDPTTQWKTQELTFRHHGPLKRFDHHRPGLGGTAGHDPDRAVYYTSWSSDPFGAFTSCIVEKFGDTRVIDLGENRVAMPELTRPIHLLDLRFHGAMRAGTVAAVAKCPYDLSQPWGRYFYETTADFGVVDGLFYLNAHNDGPAIMLYERATDALACPGSSIVRLDDSGLRPWIADAMNTNNLWWGTVPLP